MFPWEHTCMFSFSGRWWARTQGRLCLIGEVCAGRIGDPVSRHSKARWGVRALLASNSAFHVIVGWWVRRRGGRPSIAAVCGDRDIGGSRCGCPMFGRHGLPPRRTGRRWRSLAPTAAAVTWTLLKRFLCKPSASEPRRTVDRLGRRSMPQNIGQAPGPRPQAPGPKGRAAFYLRRDRVVISTGPARCGWEPTEGPF